MKGVAGFPTRFVCDEPTVMWRMQRADGLSSHAVIGLRSDGATVVWFINDRPVGFRDFDDWPSALRWSDQMQTQNWTVGWRVVAEYDDTPGRAGG
jgi:hypothetical protein